MNVGFSNIGSTMYSNANYAINKGRETVNGAASDIANNFATDTDDVAKNVSSLKEGVQQVEAGAKVLNAYKETIGSIIDLTV